MKMNRFFQSLILLSAMLTAALSPAFEAGASDTASYAGEYAFFSTYLSSAYMDILFSDYGVHAAIEDEQHVANESMVENYVTLNEDGTGYLYWGEDNQGSLEWSPAEEAGFIRISAGVSEMEAVLQDGLLSIAIDEGFTLCFASANADTSDIEVLSMEAYIDRLYGTGEDASDEISVSRVKSLFESLDITTGIHILYETAPESLNATLIYESQGRGGMYYNCRTTRISDYESSTLTLYRDRTAYSLVPEEKTASVVTTMSSALFDDNAMVMDDLYGALRTRADETDYTEETREVESVSYVVEIYPESDSRAEEAFYFDENGALKYYLKSARMVGSVEMEEVFYTIHTIDSVIDETLFDLSGYEIIEKG